MPSAEKNRWIADVNSDDGIKYRLFCFPYAGAGATVYRPWKMRLLPDIDVCPVQLPGRENRMAEQPIVDIRQMIPELVIAIKPYLDRPFAFFGHCIGALIAYELAGELQRRGLPQPDHVYASAFRAPDYDNPNKILHALSEEEFKQELKGYGGISSVILENDEVMGKLMPLFRADFALHENYQATDLPELQCPISVFGGTDDHIVQQEHMTGWADKTSALVTTKMFPGGHFFINNNRENILETIRENVNTKGYPPALPGRQ
ncbi:MAG TPA: thioesterase [Gammaproteobacteria bacterium]|nr:thioesterase [Gammaproteobacteria bacterium]